MNFLLVMTDDQLLSTMEYMPKTKALLTEKGMKFNRGYAADPVCAPARASVLTGKYVHNHKVKENENTEQNMKRIDSDTIATRLKSLGYRTGLFGKYNTDVRTQTNYVPPGWDTFYCYKGPYNDPEKLNFYANGEEISPAYNGQGEPDILARYASNFIENSHNAGKDFFCMVTPSSPHGPYMPSERHENLFRDQLLPKPPNYGEEDLSDKSKQYREKSPVISEEDKKVIRQEWIGTLRELQDVDDMMDTLIRKLSGLGLLQDTVIIFLTDNGYPYGHNRSWSKKGWPYSSMTRIPFIIRAPFFGNGKENNSLVSQIDLLPTILKAAGGDYSGVNGRPLQDIFDTTKTWRSDLLVEHFQHQEWYSLVRDKDIYIEHSTGEKEYYDLVNDPWEMESKHNSLSPNQSLELSTQLSLLKAE